MRNIVVKPRFITSINFQRITEFFRYYIDVIIAYLLNIFSSLKWFRFGL